MHKKKKKPVPPGVYTTKVKNVSFNPEKNILTYTYGKMKKVKKHD